MKISYKYKLKPSLEQEKLLAQAFGCMRYIYNWGLDVKVKAYESEKRRVSYNELAKMLTSLKKEDGTRHIDEYTPVCRRG